MIRGESEPAPMFIRVRYLGRHRQEHNYNTAIAECQRAAGYECVMHAFLPSSLKAVFVECKERRSKNQRLPSAPSNLQYSPCFLANKKERNEVGLGTFSVLTSEQSFPFSCSFLCISQELLERRHCRRIVNNQKRCIVLAETEIQSSSA